LSSVPAPATDPGISGHDLQGGDGSRSSQRHLGGADPARDERLGGRERPSGVVDDHDRDDADGPEDLESQEQQNCGAPQLASPVRPAREGRPAGLSSICAQGRALTAWRCLHAVMPRSYPSSAEAVEQADMDLAMRAPD
jgi:hypothetical protein